MDGIDERMDRLLRVWNAMRADAALQGRVDAVDEALARTIAEDESRERMQYSGTGPDDP